MRRLLIPSCIVSLSTVGLSIDAGASGFSILNGQTVYTTQTLSAPGDVGTVEAGGTIDVAGGRGIVGGNGVTVNNAGLVKGNDTGIFADNDNIITNSGTVIGSGFGITTYGSNNTITNSGTAQGYYFGLQTLSDSTITNSGTARGTSAAGAGILAYYDNTVINSGTAESGLFGIYIFNGNTVENSGTANGGAIGIYAIYDDNTITNSGISSGSESGIRARDSNRIENSGSATGGSRDGIEVRNYNTIVNSGNATGTGSDGISAVGFNTITNSGTSTGAASGISAISNNAITNTGTATGGSFGVYAENNNTILNLGRLGGGSAAVYFKGSGNTLTLLAGSNVQGVLNIAGTGDNTLAIGPRLSTALTFTGSPNIKTSGLPFVSSNGILAVVDPSFFSAEDEMLNDLTRSLADLADARLATARRGGSPADMIAATPGSPMPTADVPDLAETQTVIWAAGLGKYREQDSDGIYDGFASTLAGFAIGVDGLLRSGTRLGGFAGAGSAKLDVDAGTQDIDSDSYFAGVYSGFTMSDYFLNVAVSGGYMDQSTSRDVLNNMVKDGIEKSRGDSNGLFVNPSATFGMDVAVPGLTLTPSVRARYAALFMDSYDESGSAGDLSVDARTLSLIDVRGQFAIAIDPLVTDGGEFDAKLWIGGDATHVSGNDVNATLLGQSLNFNVGPNDTTYRGFAGLDFTYRMHGNVSLTLSGEAGYDTSDAVTLTSVAGLSWAF